MFTRSWSARRPIPSSRAGRPVRTRCSSDSSGQHSTTRPRSDCPWRSPTSARARSRRSPSSAPTPTSACARSRRPVPSTSRMRGSACKSPCIVGEHDFETVDSETLYVGKIFALRADEVRMPGGTTARREVVEHYGAVAIVALDDERNVVLVHQYRHPIGRRLWELPAGLLDMGDEPPHDTAARELEEEAGLAAEQWRV